ncbi:MAG TPA: hypothetical protein VFQ45_16260 [Longimicrobium sp.]|nr:hypothetical protein [Longimicrobium sp.]
MTVSELPQRAARRSVRRPLLLPLALPALALAVSVGAADAQTLAGRVVKAGRGVAGAPVELHRVGAQQQGLVARGTSGADGRFSFALPQVDTAAGFNVFFATALADGVRYFGPALHPGEQGAGYEIAVYDTTSARAALDSLRVARRDVILSPGVRGGWEVAEVVRVRNPGRRTVVGRDGMPAFGVAIPPRASDFETGDSEQLAQLGITQPRDLVLMGGRVLSTIPIPPGDRDLFYRYRLPPGRSVELPLAQATDTVEVYVRQPSPKLRVSGLAAGPPLESEGETYQRWVGTALRAGTAVTLRARRRGSPVDPRVAAVVVTTLLLTMGAFAALRRRPVPGVGAGT